MSFFRSEENIPPRVDAYIGNYTKCLFCLQARSGASPAPLSNKRPLRRAACPFPLARASIQNLHFVSADPAAAACPFCHAARGQAISCLALPFERGGESALRGGNSPLLPLACLLSTRFRSPCASTREGANGRSASGAIGEREQIARLPLSV